MEQFDPSYYQNLFGMQPEQDVFSPEGMQQAVSKLQQPQIVIQGQKKTLIPNSTLDELKRRQLDSFKEQSGGIKQFETDLASRQGSSGVNPILAIASGLSDMFAGTNRLGALSQQKQQQERGIEQDKLKLQEMKKDLTKSEIDMLKSQYQDESESEKLSAQMKMFDKKMESEGRIKLLPGQESADRAFGKEYQEWNAQGGYAGVEKQLRQLEEAAIALENNPDLSGGASTVLPDAVRRRINQESMTIEQDVKQATQAALRQTLGSQFTEKEGEAIMQRSYDPALPAEENIKKIRAAAKELKTRALEKERASKYFESTGGTLKGLDATGNKQSATTPKTQMAPPAIGEVRNGFKFKGGNPADKNSWEKQ